MADYIYQRVTSGGLLKVQIKNDETIASSPLSIVMDGTETTVAFEEDLTQDEQDALAALVSAHDASEGGFYEANHVVRASIPGNLTSEKWYQDCDEDNNVSNLAKEVVHEWSGKKEVSCTTKIYFKGGLVASEETINLFYDSSGKKSLEKKVI